MSLIQDINTAGASKATIVALPGMMQLQINGTFGSGDSVSLERKLPDDTWEAVDTFNSAAFKSIEVVSSSQFRTNTINASGTMSVKCDIALSAGQIIG